MKNKFLKIVIIICQLFVTYIYASDEKSLSQFDTSYLETSDFIKINTFDLFYKNHRRDLFFPYLFEEDSNTDFALNAKFLDGNTSTNNYYGYLLKGGLGYKFSPKYYIEGVVGYHFLKDKTGDNNYDTIPVALSADVLFFQNINYKFSYTRDFIYSEGFLPAGVNSGLFADNLSNDFTFIWFQELRSKITAKQKWISDGNIRQEYDVSTMYGLATTDNWIWVGLGANQMLYRFESDGYWSPGSFVSFGPRIELSVPVFDWFRYNLGGNFNYFYDDSTSYWGNGFYAATSVVYGSRNGHNASLYYEHILSSQDSKEWYSDLVGLKLIFMF